MALELALLAQCRVDGGGQGDEDAQLDHGADEVDADALEHDVDEDLADGHDDERVRPAPGVAPVVLEERPAEEDEGDRGDEGEDGADRRHGHGQGEVAADQDGFLADGEAVDHDAEIGAHEGERDDAVEGAESAVDADDQRDGAELVCRGRGEVQIVARQVVVGCGRRCALRVLCHGAPITLAGDGKWCI